MAPIRIGIVGLSANATTAWASSAHLPYLSSERGQERYKIVALLNSTEDAARKAIVHYGLPSTTRAYGKSEDLAADKDVDLVVVSTRVDTHYGAVKASLLAGKNALVEWPLAGNVEDARELVKIAKEKNLRTAVGLQGRLAQVFLKIKEVIESGRLGKVLSSEVTAHGGLIKRDRLRSGLKYFTDLKVGGNPYTIGFMHLFDSVQYVLGDIQNTKGRLQIQVPKQKILDADGKVIESVTSNVPDLIYLTGTIPESAIADHGASFFIRFRRGAPFKGEPGLVWKINGEKGELRLTSYDGASLQASTYTEPVTIEVHDFGTNEVQNVEWKWLDWQKNINPVTGRSIAALYEAFADGDESSYATFAGALKRHEDLEDYLQRFW